MTKSQLVAAALCFGLIASGARTLRAGGWGALDQAGTSADAWLLQPSSPRLLAMGGAGTASLAGVQAWGWNPAATSGDPQVNAELAFRRQTADTEMGFFSLAWPTAWGVPSLGWSYSKTDGIHGMDAFGAATGTFSTQDVALKLGWAWVQNSWHLGVAATSLQEDLYTARIPAFGLDAGAVLEIQPGLQVGASLLHAGSTREHDPLPAEIRLGAEAKLLPEVTVALDMVSPRDAMAYTAAGLEWRPLAPVAVRGGWRTGPASSWQQGGLAAFSLGAGVAWGGFALDYVYEPAGYLGDSHHLSLEYRYTQPSAVSATPKPVEAPAPRLQILPRSYEGRMVFVPKTVAQNIQAKTMTFQVRDEQGKIVRSFTFAGQSAPREMVWDGKDNQGRLVDQDKNYTFAFEYATDHGVKQEAQEWPQVSPARKLFFAEKGTGVEPSVRFRFSGATAKIKSWRLTLVNRDTRQVVRVLTGQGALPADLLWDGKTTQGDWAPADAKYAYQLELIATDDTQATIEHPVAAIPAQVISQGDGRVKFKILQILFDFARATIRAEMADKIMAAGETGNHPAAQILAIQGHADEIGTRTANLAISRKRAESVRDFLEKSDFQQAEDIPAEGFGNQRLLSIGGKEAARSQNRRVEIVLEVPAPELQPAAPNQ